MVKKKKFDPLVDPFVFRERNILRAINKYKKENGKSLSWRGRVKGDLEYVVINPGCSPQVKVKVVDKREQEILKTQFNGCGKPIFLGKDLPSTLVEVKKRVPRYFEGSFK